MKKVSTVDEYIASHPAWQELLLHLRKLLRSTGMEEHIKWSAPVYSVEGKNVIGLGAFKEHAGIWFFQGALLSDPAGVLINAQEGKTQALRQWRFLPDDEVDDALVLAYVQEAIANQQAGKEIKPEKKELIIPEALEAAFAESATLREAFEALSLSKKREYAEHIASAKREDTRQKRLEKITPMILEGKGLHDKYRK